MTEKEEPENSTEEDIAITLYGAIRQLLLEKDYFHQSYQPEYSHLTGNGERAIINLVNQFGPRLIKAIHDDDVKRSKELVLNQLKKE
jgi:hypothetical protein